MTKELPIISESEMRVLIKRIHDASIKNSGSFSITSLEDAARFAVYLHGFPSWKAYRASKHLKAGQPATSLEVEIDESKFTVKNIKRKEVIYGSARTHTNLKIPLVKSKVIPFEILVGKKRIPITKTDQPVGLLSDHTVVVASIEKNKIMYDYYMNQLKSSQQCVFAFGVEPGKYFSSNEHYVLGQYADKVDILTELLATDYFENYFDINGDDQNNNFIWLWSLLVRYYHNENERHVKIRDIIELTKLENLLNIYTMLESKKHFLSKILGPYLFKLCKIEESDSSWIVNETTQKIHFKQCFVLLKKLKNIKKLYDLGYFSETAQVNIKNALYEKKTVLIEDCSHIDLVDEYNSLYNSVYIASHIQHKALVGNSNEYKTWAIWLHGDIWVKDRDIVALSKIKNEAIFIIYAQKMNGLHKFFSMSKQILFLHNPHIEVCEVWKQNALEITQHWQENIFFNQSQNIREMEDDKALLWHPINPLDAPDGLEDYTLEKIETYF